MAQPPTTKHSTKRKSKFSLLVGFLVISALLTAGAMRFRHQTAPHHGTTQPQATAHVPSEDWNVSAAQAASPVKSPLETQFPLRQLMQKPVFGTFDGGIEQCDVLVVGGTPAGVAAALAAARRGAKVVLIEERPHLGGDIVYQMLNMWDVPLRAGTASPVVQGIFAEFFDQLGVAFDIEKAMHLFEESAAAEPNLQTYIETRIKRILKSGDRVTGVVLRGTGDAEHTLKARTFVDATSDATFAARAGSGYFLGRQKSNPDKAMQSAGLLFAVSGVNWLEAKKYTKRTLLRPLSPQEVRRVKYAIDLRPVSTAKGLMIKERLGGGVHDYLWERGNIVKAYKPQGPNTELLSINFGRQKDGSVVLNTLNILGVNGLSESSVSNARREALAELPLFMNYLRKTMPGFENARISEIAPELYIRETRHIQGIYMLTAQDIQSETRFPDRIALASYPLDLHPYVKGETNPLAPQRFNYTIPLRSLIPSRIDGVFVASRSLSATSAAAGSARVLPITMACGEAAGAAAWLCVQYKCTPQTLASEAHLVAALQDNLRDWGADIGDKYPPRPQNQQQIPTKLAAAMNKIAIKLAAANQNRAPALPLPLPLPTLAPVIVEPSINEQFTPTGNLR